MSVKTSLTNVIHESVLNGNVPAKAIAEQIGKPYTTMLREINPYDTGAKVGVDLLLPIMQATDSVDPLKHLAREMGYVLVPMKSSEAKNAGGNPLAMALKLLESYGALSKHLQNALANQTMAVSEFEDVERAGYDTVMSTLEVIETLRTMVMGQEEADEDAVAA